MIISGGVNIYPREIEDVLIQHPAVADVAVFGVPNDEFGEEVKAVVELLEGHEPTDRSPPSCWPSAASTWPGSRCHAASTSPTTCRACPPASSTSASCATGTWQLVAPR
jgi:acyl-CoA synthetase (AMP-forming)/AMP-acid ligase II